MTAGDDERTRATADGGVDELERALSAHPLDETLRARVEAALVGAAGVALGPFVVLVAAAAALVAIVGAVDGGVGGVDLALQLVASTVCAVGGVALFRFARGYERARLRRRLDALERGGAARDGAAVGAQTSSVAVPTTRGD